MTVYLATNDAVDFGGGLVNSTDAGTFEAGIVSNSIRITNVANGAYPVAIGIGADVSADTDAWIHFDHHIGNTVHSSSDGSWLRLLDKEGRLRAYIDFSNGAASTRVYARNGTSYANSASTFLLPVSSRATWDLHFHDDGTDSTFEVYMGGTLVSSISVSSGTGAGIMPSRLQFDNNDIIVYSGYTYYSQVIWANESTIGMKLQILEADALGNYSDMSATVAEVADSDVTTGWVSGVVGNKQSFTTGTYTPPTGRQVHSVQASIDLRTGATGPQAVEPFVRIGGTDYAAAAPITANAVTRRALACGAFPLNPATGLAWTTAEISALEMGIEVKA